MAGVTKPVLTLGCRLARTAAYLLPLGYGLHKFLLFCFFRINVLANNLYPPVEYPAPVGTPLISPYIQWDHSQTWDVPKAEDFPTGSGGSGAATVYNIGVYWSQYVFLFPRCRECLHALSADLGVGGTMDGVVGRRAFFGTVQH